jgi:hypothetical protein
VPRGTRASFIVRVVRDRRGTGCGVIERVATGAKEAFPGVEAIGLSLITRKRGILDRQRYWMGEAGEDPGHPGADA